MANGDQNCYLNFPEDETEVRPKERTTYKYFGVTYYKRSKKWCVKRWSKAMKKLICNGHYEDEETAAHASDSLARKLMSNDEENLKLNFPNDLVEVRPKKRATISKYFGVTYNEKFKTWTAQRWSKAKKKILTDGNYKDEETAAHASDTLARKLMKNGEQNHKLNFPDDSTEVYRAKNQTNKRKRPLAFVYSQTNEYNRV